MVIDGCDAEGYATARMWALRGVHLLAVRCEHGTPTPLLKARAAENRVFVVASGDRGDVFDPTGRLVEREPSDPPAFTLRTRDAANKALACGTDTLAGREPAIYEF